MISVEQTIDILKKNQPEKKISEVDLMQSLGMILAQDIVATIPSPPYTNSAMDGFAVRWQDVEQVQAGHEVVLTVVGESSAGFPFKGNLKKDQAIRISTGAIIARETDTIIPIEHCIVEPGKVKIRKAGGRGQHVRYAGEEFLRGQKLLDPGIEIKSAHIGLIASLGISRLKVFSRPRVIIMTTGSELVPFAGKAEKHQLRDSNTPMLFSAVVEAGGIITENIHIKDDSILTLKGIKKAAQTAEIILSSGGVSIGEHDHVRKMALKAGFSELFWKVNQKPGKPMFVAKKEQTLLIALPGNPVSAYICFKHYVRPLLQSMQGKAFDWPSVTARVQQAIKNPLDRTHLMRVKLQNTGSIPVISVLEKQGSHMPSSIALADGYIILAEGAQLKAGSKTKVFLF